MKFPGSKLAVVAFAGVLLGAAMAWIGARQPDAATTDASSQPASAPQRLAPGGYANPPAPSRPRPATRTRAS